MSSCPILNATADSENASSLTSSVRNSCSANQSALLASHPWLFSPAALHPLLCLGTPDFCGVTRQKNCHFADSIRPYSALFCVFNALNIVNNALSFAVFRRQEGTTALTQRIVALLLKSLSLVEILFHFFFLLYHITEYCLFNSALSFPGIGPSIFFCLAVNILVVLQTTFHIARNWVIVIVSTFRYEAVCRAMKPGKVFTSVARVHGIVAAIVVVSFFISLPRIVYFSCVACERDGGQYSLDSLELRLNHQLYGAFKNVYLIAALLVFQTGGPILTVCIFSCCIMLGLRRHRKLKQALKKSAARVGGGSGSGGGGGGPASVSQEPQQPQRVTTAAAAAASQQASRGNLLVIVLCVTFLVLEFPLFISKILEDKIADKDVDAMVVHMSKFATLFDSFINIFIYSISNRKFREDLSRLVRFHRLRQLVCWGDGQGQVQGSLEETVALRTPNVVTVAAAGARDNGDQTGLQK